jgi:hypothetical protein
MANRHRTTHRVQVVLAVHDPAVDPAARAVVVVAVVQAADRNHRLRVNRRRAADRVLKQSND